MKTNHCNPASKISSPIFVLLIVLEDIPSKVHSIVLIKEATNQIKGPLLGLTSQGQHSERDYEGRYQSPACL